MTVLKKRLVQNALSGFRLKSRKRQKHTLKRDDDPAFLKSWYRQWFEFVDGFGSKVAGHHIYVPDGSFEAIKPAADWARGYDGSGS